jgi:hypothetical protein
MNCFIDYRATEEELLNLQKLNINPILVPKTNLVYPAIDGHVDIQLNIIDKDTVIVQKSISPVFLFTLSKYNIKYILSESSLSSKYPSDIILNALIMNDYFIHNLKFTDKNLLSSQKSKKLINVKQGYTKCSVLPLKEKVAITNDRGIYNSLLVEGFDMLLIPPGDILLPSLNYGFIGGVGGMISEDELALFGSLEYYKYGELIKDFLKKYKIKALPLKKGKLVDRGSLLLI